MEKHSHLQAKHSMSVLTASTVVYTIIYYILILYSAQTDSTLFSRCFVNPQWLPDTSRALRTKLFHATSLHLVSPPCPALSRALST